MDYKTLFSNIFHSMSLPVVIGSFDEDEVVQYPFIEYHRDSNDHTFGDDTVINKTTNWSISLYSKKKEVTNHWELVDNLESLLDNFLVSYETSGDIFIDDDVVMTTFDLALNR